MMTKLRRALAHWLYPEATEDEYQARLFRVLGGAVDEVHWWLPEADFPAEHRVTTWIRERLLDSTANESRPYTRWSNRISEFRDQLYACREPRETARVTRLDISKLLPDVRVYPWIADAIYCGPCLVRYQDKLYLSCALNPDKTLPGPDNTVPGSPPPGPNNLHWIEVQLTFNAHEQAQQEPPRAV